MATVLSSEHDGQPARSGARITRARVSGRRRKTRKEGLAQAARFGQVHGGIIQGLGQALFEETVYGEDGQMLTPTLVEYLVPSAADVPPMTLSRTVTPSPSNPLGVKGIGEAGTIGASAAIVNAAVDALSGLGIRHLEMPMQPGRVWKAMQEATS